MKHKESSLIILLFCLILISCSGAAKKSIVSSGGRTISPESNSSTVSSADNTIPLDALLRRASGVQVKGEGASAAISIRGINSFSSGSESLFVLNGSAYNGNFSNLFYSINTLDIKSVYVLKDAGSTAIYGSRGANGVIVINLKN